MAKGIGTMATGGKQRGSKVVVGSTSTVRLGKDKRVTQTKGGTKPA